ncbi:ectoine hydroxylase [Acidocella aminolytica]|jgi:ectoine hydroxylase|uniref:Ectoine hydroxylase n=1 Tax=Acidocella aminolytica 101 = DSM 11237 TaxID=1120923 RepID=A0A0D6PC99_9PROT|nr:ectoine hydroxylase [Acidocella aminolytica]GAN78828.1 phytanoyl-CoA dioxygenase/ectoine hydroxylase [Acidocella aminolytica 101 = DSM 11237]GBQ33271.1 ectoine hydroxylase [Acidocella aminolytica 101 = DSM 11237]SHF17656.1 ectoine hydroxylase [Acidocella aminolytica 101 = DSM 11237]
MTDLYPSRQSDKAVLRLRQDPVFYGRWTEDAPLTKAQTDFYEQNGFLVLDNLFSEAEIALLQNEATRLITNPANVSPETIITERNSNEVRSIFAIHDQNALLARLSADQRLAGAASYLLDDEVYIHQSRLNYKPGFAGKEFYWHSDFETWHVEDGMPRMRALSISVLLKDNNANNGPLMVMPGSHRSYVTCVGETPDDHYKASLKKQEYGVPDHDSLAKLASAHGIEAATGKAGTVIMFDCNTMHGSNGNITPYPRSNAFFVYNARSNALVEPFGPKTPRPPFIADRRFKTLSIAEGSLTQRERAA